ncbi:hypothetical protein CYMTET_44848 [Cymbomonas tetramitiformis]|uniref:Sulfotransferase n=1 Tax=Cymbomonas tetramitiformis TaxID=36881 RepID=A0AAE0EZ71_9CHLO|nr:hypothetical protein CYMTET_44848 [Cymbomonas tetramitiformis]
MRKRVCCVQDSNVLWLFYEDMLEDLEGTVRKVAKFIDCGTKDDAIIEEAVKRSSFKFMSENSHKFDEHVSKRLRNPAMGLPPDAGSTGSKVRQGSKGSGKVKLPEDIQAALYAKWAPVQEVTGFETYEDMRRAGISTESTICDGFGCVLS